MPYTEYEFPSSIPAFTISLPLTVETHGPDIVEINFAFELGDVRTYQSEVGGFKMMAAAYECDIGIDPGVVSFALLKSIYTGKVNEALGLIAKSFGHRYALVAAYENQEPPLPVPDNLGWLSPASEHTVSVLDGTARYRGMAGGMHSLDPSLVPTVEIYFDPVWATQREPI